MNQYSDIKIVECNRLHSEEAKSGNNENFSLWTNNLQDVVHLEPGDKVSVYQSMISERGAGQGSSIEIKGENLGFTKSYTFINISGVNASSELPGGFEELRAIETTEIKNIRDDIGYFKISYYINMDAHNYIQLPRRWWFRPTNRQGNFTAHDDRDLFGMSLSDPFATDDYVLYDDFYQLSGSPGYGDNQDNGYLSKVRNDNSRFTIMMRDKTYYSESSASGNLLVEGRRDPENAIYYMYEELKEIKVEKGFNSPEYISEEITRQLQEVKEQTVFEKRSPTDLSDNPNRPGFAVPVYGTYSTETYKPFNCAGLYAVDTNVLQNTPETYFNYYITAGSGTSNASGWEYLQNYHIVGCKRPELYTTGRLINRELNTYTGIKGTKLNQTYNGLVNPATETSGFLLDLIYNTTNLNYLRDFILAQEKYPEIWNVFSDTRTPYNSGDTINNSRWFHMNRFQNASMESDTLLFQLGWGGYQLPTGGNASSNYNSVIVPFEYDDTQRDKYYSIPNEELGQRTYGCFGRGKTGSIVVFPTENNGSGSTLFNMLNNASNHIENGRRCGYDMHFTAPGTAWCLPFSGFTQTPIDYDNRGQNITDYRIARNSQAQIIDNYKVDTSDQRRQLYLGADEPELKWDGTHFSFSQLHTALYRGNNAFADNPFYLSIATDTDPQADEKVFKINPIELYRDYTPARMPYIDKKLVTINENGSDKNFYSKVLNANLEAWTIYDAQCGIAIEDFGLDEDEWAGTLWDLLGFSYKQFHSSTNTRLKRIDNTNLNDLSVITTNANVLNEKSQAYSQNMWGAPLYNNMMPLVGSIVDKHGAFVVSYFPPIVVGCDSVDIVADNLPTRMIRGYYTIRSNILQDAPFIGGKVNNTQMPIIGVVNKINGTGDFYTQEEGSLDFTITKPLRLASLTCSVHDPDGSYANTSEQNTILFKIQKNKNVSFNVVQEIIQENKGKIPPFL